jgi:phosphate transport system permease protein
MGTSAQTIAILPRLAERAVRRRHWWREVKDQAFKHIMTVGGVTVVLAIVTIFFYLLYMVAPLFQSARAQPVTQYTLPGDEAPTVLLATEEYGELGLRLTASGHAYFFNARDGSLLSNILPDALAHARISTTAAGPLSEGLFVYGLEGGTALVVKPIYSVSYAENNRRQIHAELSYPLGVTPMVIDPQTQSLRLISVQGRAEDGISVVAVTQYHRMILARFTEEKTPTDESSLNVERTELPIDGAHVSGLLLGTDQKHLVLANDDGSLDYYDLRKANDPKLIDHARATSAGATITSLRWLSGGISLLVGDSAGVISQWFPVHNENNQYRLARVREFHIPGKVTAIVPEYFRKGFAALDDQGHLGLYYTTAERTLLQMPVVTTAALVRGVLSPRANTLLLEDGARNLRVWHVDNPHPEVSLHSLWGKVWYESREQPEYIWQSSAANSDFEPKFSLTPLALGSLKAAFYALLFAIPLAIMSAIYAGYFMAPRLRGYIKPAIETMGALPTVILGFLAGLWLAPLVEAKLAGIVLIFILMPFTVFTAAYLWSRLPASVRHRMPEGYEAILLLPVVCLTVVVAMSLSTPVEELFFSGDLPLWISTHLGLRFDQRNSLVVGIAMGVAVVPIIFSISEDAIFSVPRHLTIGSLALGATPWQTLIRVVLLTASPGIFSAIMIGLGRAVGETMIVLMATGNTPVINFNIFEGFRALSANTAVEMPESEVGSTHFRILFLASLLLFAVTFIFNTAAEIVRLRLRDRYGNL